MCRELVHIYGPISIYSYGVMILLGLAIILVLLLYDPVRKKIITNEQLLNAVAFGLLSGIIGGRLLYLLCNWQSIESCQEIFSLWDGGLALMGAIIGILTTLPFYLRFNQIPQLIFFDTIAVYIPLLQSTARVGCFFAGCCYGSPTAAFWGICHWHMKTFSNVGEVIHPVQLYSSLMQLLIFATLIFFRRNFYKKPGQLISLYLIFACLERFITDFWRGDREFFPRDFIGFLSVHQFIALFIAGISVVAFFIFSQRKANLNEYI